MVLITGRPPTIPNWSDLYPEAIRSADGDDPDDGVARIGNGLARRFPGVLVRRPLRAAALRINRRMAQFSSDDDAAMAVRVADLRRRLRRENFSSAVTDEASAIVCEYARRSMGLKPHVVQIMGSLALIRGLLVEMETGEGKTLTAALATAIAALAGVPVHVFTVNEYLAARDRSIAAPLLSALGLTSGLVTQKMSDEERREHYKSIVVYGTNNQFVFDYLRDRVAAGSLSYRHRVTSALLSDDGARKPPMLRGLHMALIDEADSILIDEARTPLVLSRKREDTDATELLVDATALARSLEEGRDFHHHKGQHRCALTEQGRQRLSQLAPGYSPLLAARRRREEAVAQALFALHALSKGREYVISDGKVQIVDESTGRIMADRSWSQGLHQLVEIKEGLPPTAENDTLAQITYQRFFRRYRHLCGMTGTAREIERETYAVYGLPVVALPPNKKSRRRIEPAVIVGTIDAKLAKIVERAKALHVAGSAVLIGTRTVAASERLSAELARAGIAHNVLNALNDRDEADIVASAGQSGRITVATNLAGRGTDIKLGPGVAEMGGLVVLMTERHESARVDRQLIGRCGRQGDPGLAEAYLSLEDELIAKSSFHSLAVALRPLVASGPAWGRSMARVLFRLAQRERERQHARIRHQCLEQDKRLADLLAFSGVLE